MKPTVLIIDDDRKLTALLGDYLGQFSYTVVARHHPVDGIDAVRKGEPDVVILDVMLPDMDGFEVCRSIRKFSNVPIIMLTARGDVTDRIVGLELGADDYLAKPFEPRELAARIQALLRRSAASEETVADDRAFSVFKINKDSRQVRLKDELLDLTSLEYDLLILFADHAGQVLGRDQIMEKLKGNSWSSFDRSVDVLISRLRKKLHQAGPDREYIKTIWGSGYMFLTGSQEDA